jgi:hypothetical protein
MADPHSLLRGGGFIPYKAQALRSNDAAAGTDRSCLSAARSLYDLLSSRRSVRYFSDRAVDRAVIETLIMTASSAPSGANKQPWRFVAISDPAIKRQIRIAAEHE